MAVDAAALASRTMVGITLAVGGTMITALGNHLIVKGHMLSRKQQTELGTTYLLLGNACVVVLGTGLGLAAFAYAPQSVLSPLGGLTVVWNLLLATLPAFGGVSPKGEEILYTLVTLLGMAVVVAMGPQNRGEKSSFGSLGRSSFILVIISYCGSLAWMNLARTENKMLQRIFAGSSSAIVGGLSNVFAKSAVEFYSGNQVLSERDDFTTFSLVAAIALGLAISQLMLLNHALAQYSAVQIIPIYQTCLCIAATMSGGIAFDEFRDLTLFQLFFFAFGVGLAVFGVLLSALRGSASTLDQEKD